MSLSVINRLFRKKPIIVNNDIFPNSELIINIKMLNRRMCYFETNLRNNIVPRYFLTISEELLNFQHLKFPSYK